MTKTQAWIEERIAEGRTVYLTTYLRSIKITPKTFAKWAASGTPLISNDGTATYVAHGKGRVCIDGCKITAR